MSGFLFFVGLVWIIVELIKEASIKPCPPGHDHNAAVADYYKSNLTPREFSRRIDAGYYVRK